MVLLSVVVGFVGVLSLLNLALTAAVIRRLREHEQVLAGDAVLPAFPAAPMRAVGERIGAFDAVTVDDEHVTRETLLDGTMVGFFDPDCETCHEKLPGFVASARELPGGKSATLAVVGAAEGADDLVRQLRQAARVTVEPRLGEVQRAFDVRMFPAFCRLGSGQVVAAHGYEAERAPAVAR